MFTPVLTTPITCSARPSLYHHYRSPALERVSNPTANNRPHQPRLAGEEILLHPPKQVTSPFLIITSPWYVSAKLFVSMPCATLNLKNCRCYVSNTIAHTHCSLHRNHVTRRRLHRDPRGPPDHNHRAATTTSFLAKHPLSPTARTPPGSTSPRISESIRPAPTARPSRAPVRPLASPCSRQPAIAGQILPGRAPENRR